MFLVCCQSRDYTVTGTTAHVESTDNTPGMGVKAHRMEILFLHWPKKLIFCKELHGNIEIAMKYQQLENLESGWKWKYLVKKHREGELITRYIEASAAQEAVDVLLSLENEPVLVNGWIDKHMNPELVNRMKQTIRARRKRHFNAEHQHTRKKSIDLEFIVWQRLAGLAQRRGKTLSETIVQLIEDAENKEKYANKMSSLKQDLQALLGKE